MIFINAPKNLKILQSTITGRKNNEEKCDSFGKKRIIEKSCENCHSFSIFSAGILPLGCHYFDRPL